MHWQQWRHGRNISGHYIHTLVCSSCPTPTFITWFLSVENTASCSTPRNLVQTFLPVVSWSVHFPQWVPSLTIGETLNKGIPQVFLARILEFPQHILAKGVVGAITVSIFELSTSMTRQRFAKAWGWPVFNPPQCLHVGHTTALLHFIANSSLIQKSVTKVGRILRFQIHVGSTRCLTVLLVGTHVLFEFGVQFPTLFPRGAWLAHMLAQSQTAQVVTEIR